MGGKASSLSFPASDHVNVSSSLLAHVCTCKLEFQPDLTHTDVYKKLTRPTYLFQVQSTTYSLIQNEQYSCMI